MRVCPSSVTRRFLHSLSAGILALLALFWLIMLNITAQAVLQLRPNFWITDGTVETIAHAGDQLYIGGIHHAKGVLSDHA